MMVMVRSGHAACAGAAPNAATAAASAANIRSVNDGLNILGIAPYEPGKPVEEVIKAARWHKFFGFGDWVPDTDTRLQNGLDRIRQSYQKKDYLMATVTLDQMNYLEDANRVVPVLDVNGGARVSVEVSGTKISKGRLKQLIPVYQEQSVDKDLLVEGRKNLDR